MTDTRTVPRTVTRALATARIDATTAECVRALDAAGVPHLLLKGPTTARWLYVDGTPRPYVDSDLMVPPACRHRALAVLAGLGFVETHEGADSPHAVSLVRRPAGPAGPASKAEQVDLHHGYHLVGGDAVWDVLSRDTEELEVGGAPVRMPAAPGRCLVLALHVAADGPTGAKPLEDLRRGRRLASDYTWARAAGFAAELGVEHVVRAACVLAGDPLPAPAGAAGGWAEVPIELQLRVKGAVPGAAALAGLRRHRGRDRLRYAARRAFPSRSYMAGTYGAHTTPALLRAHGRRLGLMVLRLPWALRDIARAERPPVPVDHRP